jgi:hypothetical protein
MHAMNAGLDSHPPFTTKSDAQPSAPTSMCTLEHPPPPPFCRAHAVAACDNTPDAPMRAEQSSPHGPQASRPPRHTAAPPSGPAGKEPASASGGGVGGTGAGAGGWALPRPPPPPPPEADPPAPPFPPLPLPLEAPPSAARPPHAATTPTAATAVQLRIGSFLMAANATSVKRRSYSYLRASIGSSCDAFRAG